MVLSSNTFWSICAAKFILVIVLVSETLGSNYPDSATNPKPCAKKKNVIIPTMPICVPQGKNSWTMESQDNCVKVLKQQCPEFNEGECMWYTWKPAGCKDEIMLPACRLKYYAKRYTWMEIYYVNQYGTSPDSNRTVFDIIEMHRLIKNHDAFPNADQGDYPENVLDDQGERGLTWTPQDNSRIKIMTAEPICYSSDEGQNLCNIFIKNLMEIQYREGFDNSRGHEVTTKEAKHKAKITWTHTAECSKALIDNVKTDVCKILFKRVSSYPSPDTCRIVLEGQVYSEKNNSQLSYMNPKDMLMNIRYAYYNHESDDE